MKKKSYILIYAAAAFIIFLSIGTLLIPDVVFSPDENRYLTEKPDFTVKRESLTEPLRESMRNICLIR